MRQAYKHFLSVCAFFVLISSTCAHAEEFRAKVLKVDGGVHIIDAAGNRHTVEESKFLVREMDTIETAEGGNAVVRFNDGTLSVLDQNSSLRIENSRWLAHLGGRIYFVFNKVFGQPRQVKTSFATIGIRGTTFIVYDDDSGQAVALREGLLTIESTGPVFEIYRHKNLDEFEAFKQQELQQQKELREEFDDYSDQIQREFVEYKQSLILQPDRVIRFDGNRVDEKMIDDTFRTDFKRFETVTGELLEEFREQALQYRETLEQQQQLDETDFE